MKKDTMTVNLCELHQCPNFSGWEKYGSKFIGWEKYEKTLRTRKESQLCNIKSKDHRQAYLVHHFPFPARVSILIFQRFRTGDSSFKDRGGRGNALRGICMVICIAAQN